MSRVELKFKILKYTYRVSHHVSDLGWVDLDFGCSTTLLGQADPQGCPKRVHYSAGNTADLKGLFTSQFPLSSDPTAQNTGIA